MISVGADFLVSDCFAVQKSMTCLSSGGKVQARKSMPVSSPRRLMAGFIVRITKVKRKFLTISFHPTDDGVELRNV